MTKQQKWFRAIVIGFALVLGMVSYDISRRTTFPGSKPQLKERLKKNFMLSDSSEASTTVDTLRSSAKDSIR